LITPTSVPEVGAPIVSSAAVVEVENMVYFGVLDNLVYALDKDIGEMVWYFETGGQVYGSPVYAGGVLYVGGNDGQLYALDARASKLLWSYQTGGFITGSPAMSDGHIYFGSQDGSVYALR
jgi:outer membrane protein assembly factor BamB